MKDEIKEIITEMQLRNGRYIICKNEDISFSDEDYKAHLLLDYITNLQNRTKELEQINEEHRRINGELHEELERYKSIIDEAIDYLRDIRQSTFTKYNSNEWNNCLSFNDDIKPLLDKLQELKGE